MSSLVEHLHRVGQTVEQSQQPKPEDGGAVGPDPVLDERGLLPLHPGVEPRHVQHREENKARQDELDDHVFYHGATVPALAPESGPVGVISTP